MRASIRLIAGASFAFAVALDLTAVAHAQTTPASEAKGAASSAVARTETVQVMTMERLQQIVTDMGYTPKVDGTTFTIDEVGDQNRTVTFSLEAPGSPLTLYLYLQTFSPTELKQLDQAALLASNSERYSYFAITQVKKQYDLYLYRSTLSAGLTAAGIREMLEQFPYRLIRRGFP